MGPASLSAPPPPLHSHSQPSEGNGDFKYNKYNTALCIYIEAIRHFVRLDFPVIVTARLKHITRALNGIRRRNKHMNLCAL